jgi:hypothetical protein
LSRSSTARSAPSERLATDGTRCTSRAAARTPTTGAAVERDTPALTVGAGLMSRPILERAGFSIVGWEDVLLDEIA